MSILTENEIDVIRSNVKSNIAVKSETLIGKIGKELYDKCIDDNLLELKTGKAKFNVSAWKIIKPKKTTVKKTTKAQKVSFDIKQYEDEIKEIIKKETDKIFPLIQELEERIKVLEKLTAEEVQQNKKYSSDDFKELLKEEYNRINFMEKRGGMVPIPNLWDELTKKGIGRNQFEEELFKLEKERIIELQIASDPKLVKEKDKSINHPSRGLINYVVWRR